MTGSAWIDVCDGLLVQPGEEAGQGPAAEDFVAELVGCGDQQGMDLVAMWVRALTAERRATGGSDGFDTASSARGRAMVRPEATAVAAL